MQNRAGIDPADGGRATVLELLGPQERGEEIDKKQKRHSSNDDVFHGSKSPAGVGVNDAYGEKADSH
jgi:hypothetical protein